MKYAVYDSTGTILWIVIPGEGSTPNPPADGSGLFMVDVAEEVTDSGHYILNGEAQPKQVFPIVQSAAVVALGTVSMFSAVPAGTQVILPEAVLLIDDGVFEYSSDIMETVEVEFQHHSFHSKIFKVTTV